MCVSLLGNIDQESPPESLVKLEVILSSQTFLRPPFLPLLYFRMLPSLFYFCVPTSLKMLLMVKRYVVGEDV